MPAKITEKGFRALASSLNLRWIEKELPANTTKQTVWRCANGHEFLRSYKKLRARPYCSYCEGRNRNKVADDYHRLAKSKKYKWLGPLPKSGLHPTSWRCDRGHEFTHVYSQLKRGVVCGECTLLRRRNSPDDYHTLAKSKGLAWQGPEVTSIKEITEWKCGRGHVFSRCYDDVRQAVGCPECNIHGTSRIELRVFSELQAIYGKVLWRHKLQKQECDLYIPNEKIAIEIDGSYWHRNKRKNDIAKNARLKSIGIRVYRLREYPLEKISKQDLCYKSRGNTLAVMKELMGNILADFPKSKSAKKIKSYIKRQSYLDPETHRKLITNLPSPPIENSLLAAYPKIAMEWDYGENAPLVPEMFLPKSEKKVFWKCKKHVRYDMRISDRTGSHRAKCPYCSGRRVYPGESLADVFPRIASEWHAKKNKKRPEEYTPHSKEMVWWKCKRNSKHEWDMVIGARTGAGRQGCPFCAGTRVMREESFGARYLVLAKDWHPAKNKGTPYDYTPMSHYKAWWKCKKGHVWRRVISSCSTRQLPCPTCAADARRKQRSKRAHQVAKLIRSGRTNLEAAEILGTTAYTVGNVRRIARELGLL